MWGVPHEKVQQIASSTDYSLLSRGKQSSLRPERFAFFEHRHAATLFELQGARPQMRVCTLSLQFSSFLRSHHSYSDEFAEVKAVKLLRRGRRLQQVESVSTLSFVFASFVQVFLQGRLRQNHR
jgi:hypothetical protein